VNVITYSLWHYSLLMYEDEGKIATPIFVQNSTKRKSKMMMIQVSNLFKDKTENTILSIKYTLSTFTEKLNDIFSYKTDYD